MTGPRDPARARRRASAFVPRLAASPPAGPGEGPRRSGPGTIGGRTAMAAEEGLAAASSTDELRRRVAELEAENAELRRARRMAVELEASQAALRESEARFRV